MQLRVQPTGHSIECAPGENLLDALRRANVPISYSCAAGRCGTCRCKIIDSAAPDIAATAEDGVVLACQVTLTGDCTIEIPEPDEIVVHPARLLKGIVQSIDAPVKDVRIVRIKTNRLLEFSPGQFASLQIAPGIERHYSMASLAGDALLEFHIRVVPDGAFSGHVAHKLSPGDTLRISGPLGTSYLRRKHAGPIVCVAGGTGLAPVLSIVRGALEGGHRDDIHLYFGVRSEADVYGASALEALRARFPNLHVNVVVASGAAHDGHRAGLVTDALAHDWPASDALGGFRGYVCGSPPMVDAVRAVLIAHGIEDGHIYADAFYAQTPALLQPA
ncbi:2Fe-2S iron-sulfur cluster-binding protein [Paraburkholderia sp. Ac-20347]|uniref:2Fe-2S iron-sulfur cluster-binding protein n=1 Tax=Paraburkholderia sp. Ac-20347 TaxID=2703892 RepID=UPI001981C510|nr:2Fe-2S iron-sulfur cluster-binding protein [Paraburkholderia sp. Ac-20347]MBN3807632.1 2Fe-2S iron-sulfur cluster binding domain-containing protein [Paraburkholderia sp. Ac-20347]